LVRLGLFLMLWRFMEALFRPRKSLSGWIGWRKSLRNSRSAGGVEVLCIEVFDC
jgi:hypothetical protein